MLRSMIDTFHQKVLILYRNPQMKAHFYFNNNSAFRFIPVPLPQCFIELDDKFDVIFNDFSAALRHPSVKLAMNVCRRMADVELYACFISDWEKDKDIWKACIIIGSLLVAYFGACKSFLDSISITLNILFNLALSNKEQDVGKRKFWSVLQKRDGAVYSRYVPFRRFFNDIIRWREAAVHRVTPLVIVHMPTDPPNVPRDKMVLRVVAHPEPDFGQLIKSPTDVHWIGPIDLHNQWHSEFITLCNNICSDIRDRT